MKTAAEVVDEDGGGGVLSAVAVGGVDELGEGAADEMLLGSEA